MASRNARPNAFVAVRIPSPDIRTKVEEVQRALLVKHESLESTFDPAARNHITVLVLQLNNPTEIKRAKQALFEATQKVKSDLDLINDPLVLNFSGLGTFSDNVLFAKVAQGPSKERLLAMAGIVESVFVTKGLAAKRKGEYTPHLTIAKLSCARDRPHGIDYPAYAEELSDTEFGSQSIEGLELLSMSIADDGYYEYLDRSSFVTQ